jgi:hypothetical protein
VTSAGAHGPAGFQPGACLPSGSPGDADGMSTGSASQERMIYLDQEEKVGFID